MGYIHEGRFYLLFSAGIPLGSRTLGVDVPHTFEPLDKGPIVEKRYPEDHLRSGTSKQVGADVGGSVSAPGCVRMCFSLVGGHHADRSQYSSIGPGGKVAFEIVSKQGAALITSHQTYHEQLVKMLNYRCYIKKHYQSWVDFAREKQFGDDIKPFLVTAVDLTKEWAAIAYSGEQTHMRCEFSVGTPAVASASATVWGSWDTPDLVHKNCGPDHIQPFEGIDEGYASRWIPEDYNQCVFIEGYTIRKRFFIPLVMKAGAGPHQLPDPSRDDTEAAVVKISNDDDLMELDYPEILVGPEHHPCLPLLMK